MDPAEKPLVCVIDDETSVRELAEKILTKRGYAVRSYGLVADFLAVFDEAATSCIITDLRMPGQDGMHLQQCLKQMGSIVAVIVLTGYADVRAEALLAHATQVDPTSPFWFGLPPEIQRDLHPYDDYFLAHSRVGTTKATEDDLFAGVA